MKKDLKKVLILGSGPVVIGQSSEFDYSAVQACHAFKKEGISVVMINSNPAAISTGDCADSVYIEPLNVDVVRRIIKDEKPDAILPTVGGDLGLDIALSLSKNGDLSDNDVALLAVTPELIANVQNASKFHDFLESIDEPAVASKVVNKAEAAVDYAEKVGFPVIINPAYSLKDRMDEFCYNEEDLKKKAEKLISSVPIHQIRVEKSISGWKELEYEAIRDCDGNIVIVSNIEYVDPVGIHTGDSIAAVPAMTLTEKESSILRESVNKILNALDVKGSCNVQFALKPDGSEYAVLEVDPRVSRSSALVSKAAGYDISKVSAEVALGYTLLELGLKEPNIKKCCVKMPKWSYENFSEASKKLGTVMHSTGESIAIADSFETAFVKAIRSINANKPSSLFNFSSYSDDEIISVISRADTDRIYAVYEALRRGCEISKLNELTKICPYFLEKIKNIAQLHNNLIGSENNEFYDQAKAMGFTDSEIEKISCSRINHNVSSKSTAGQTDKKKILVIGTGPSKVGQGSELDLCNVYALNALNDEGYYTISVNNNPDSVSTDPSLCDKLYIEPLSFDDIMHVYDIEKPDAVLVQFSGEGSERLAHRLSLNNVNLLGESNKELKKLQNRETLLGLLKSVNIPYTPEHHIHSTGIEADIIFDGEDYLIPGISEHIERSGSINAADSISVCPTVNVSEHICQQISDYAKRIAEVLDLRGILNIQFTLYDNKLYVVNVSAGKFHNIPYVSRLTGLNIIDIATRCMLGKKLKDLNCPTGVYNKADLFAVRVPVFSFDKIFGADTRLSEQMQSTGEVMGIADNFEDALLKALIASGTKIKRSGAVLITVRNSDKQDAISLAEKFSDLDFKLYATSGTARLLNSNFVATNSLHKLHEESPTLADVINENKIVYVVSTSEMIPQALEADKVIRRLALKKQIPVFTHLDTAYALVRCLAKKRSLDDMLLVDIKKI